MKRIETFELSNGQVLEYYTTGEIIIKDNGKVSERFAPTESFTEFKQATTRARVNKARQEDAESIIRSLVGQDPDKLGDPVNQELAAKFLKGGHDGLRSFDKLLERTGVGGAEFERLGEWVVKIDGNIYHCNDHILTADVKAEIQEKVKALYGENYA